MIKIILNGKTVETEARKTILEAANKNGIEIPTLCHDKELNPFGSCWVCAVKVKDRKGFVTACGTEVSEGMDITTDSEEIRKARKLALELLLSDHYADCEAPCKIACPDKVDVQTYVSLIANGQHHEAVKVIKENLPMPLSIGRVCPAFCEEECRRTIADEPIAIRQLKRHTADFDLNDEWSYIPDKKDEKPEKIAIVGAGPSGLTCGYYLSNEGYVVTVFEAAPKAGGWLRYGIPEYRLPKKILEKEIKLMCANGMKIKTRTEIGKHITLSQLQKEYNAVYLAIGAQKAVPMRVKNSDLQGCFLGVDFLKNFALGKKQKLGKKTAIIGGGNTAIDCARTAKRMGSDVTLIYRRTRKEMPAESYEVDAAEEEGIKFYFLTNPVENFGENGKLSKVKFEKMKLGEPDESGRRRPQPTGEFFEEKFESIIAAISQSPDVDFLAESENKIDGKELPLSRWLTAIADEETQHTGIKNIFAGGDFRRGPATAIEAIADGRKAAVSIDRFIKGQALLDPIREFDSKKEKSLEDVDSKEFEQYEKIPRVKMPELDAKIRATNQKEVEIGFEENDARSEAERCLECGCQVNETCDLRKYSTEYQIDQDIFIGEKNKHPIDHSHPFILRDANKCIKCGRCVRICAEVQGPGVLGYIYRGFASYVAPEFGESLTKTGCEACGKCIEVCPVGALLPRNQNLKLNPHKMQVVYQNCGMCGTGCQIAINVSENKITTIEPAEKTGFNDRNLCFAGKFGWQIYDDEERILRPLKKINKEWEVMDDCWEKIQECSDLTNAIKENLKKSKSRKIYISPTSTNEEILLLKEVAANIRAEVSSLSLNNHFHTKISNINPKTYEDLLEAEAVVLVGKISHTLRILVRAEQRKGKRMVVVSNNHLDFNEFADQKFTAGPLDETLERILRYLCEDSESNCEETDTADPIELDLPAKTLFLYSRDHLSEDSIWNIWQIAALVCDFSKGSGVLPTSHFSNLRGLEEFGVEAADPNPAEFTILYGELPNEEQRKWVKRSRFILSVNTHKEETEIAHYIIPKTSYLEIDGSAIANDGTITNFKNAKNSLLFENLLNALSAADLISEEQTSPEYWIKKVENKLKKKSEKVMNGDQLFEYLSAFDNLSENIPVQHNVQKIWLAKYKHKIKE